MIAKYPPALSRRSTTLHVAPAAALASSAPLTASAVDVSNCLIVTKPAPAHPPALSQARAGQPRRRGPGVRARRRGATGLAVDPGGDGLDVHLGPGGAWGARVRALGGSFGRGAGAGAHRCIDSVTSLPASSIFTSTSVPVGPRTIAATSSAVEGESLLTVLTLFTWRWASEHTTLQLTLVLCC